MMDYHRCEDLGHELYLSLNNPFWYHVREFILVAGMLGNAVNIIVFRHERMKSYINSVFYWLAVFNFLILLQIAIFSLLYGTHIATNMTSGLFIPSSRKLQIHKEIPRGAYTLIHLSFYMSYILVSLHTSTVILNIAVALCLYKAIMDPEKFKVWCSTWSIKRIATHSYVFGFVLWLPDLFQIPEVILSDDDELYGPGAELVNPSRSDKWIFFLASAIVCCSLLVALLVICIKLIKSIVKARRERRDPFSNPSNAGAEREGSVDQFTKEITNLTLPIVQIFIFSITEISIAVIPTLSFVYHVVPVTSAQEMDLFLCYNYAHFFLNGVVASTVLVSSSYLTFFYVTSAHYRITFEILFRSGYGRLKRMFKLGSYREFQNTEGAAQQDADS